MAQRIPLLDLPRQSLLTDLGGQAVRLAVWWQPAEGGWYASLESPPGTPIVSGRRIVLDQPLVAPTPGPFRGDLYCRGIPPLGGEPGRAAWATPTHAYVYLPEASA